MWMGAVTADPTGLVERTTIKKFGDFVHDGVVKRFDPPKPLASFPLRNELKFPIDYQVVLVLAEKDKGGGLDAQLDKFARQGKDAALATAKSLGATALDKLPEVVASGNVTWETVAAAIGKELLTVEARKIWRDDVFQPKLETLRVDTKDFRFPHGKLAGPQTKVVFRGHEGVCQVVYSWKLI
jgi:hypothetical protein